MTYCHRSTRPSASDIFQLPPSRGRPTRPTHRACHGPLPENVVRRPAISPESHGRGRPVTRRVERAGSRSESNVPAEPDPELFPVVHGENFTFPVFGPTGSRKPHGAARDERGADASRSRARRAQAGGRPDLPGPCPGEVGVALVGGAARALVRDLIAVRGRSGVVAKMTTPVMTAAPPRPTRIQGATECSFSGGVGRGPGPTGTGDPEPPPPSSVTLMTRLLAFLDEIGLREGREAAPRT